MTKKEEIRLRNARRAAEERRTFKYRLKSTVGFVLLLAWCLIAITLHGYIVWFIFYLLGIWAP